MGNEIKTKIIHQKNLSAECWSIQFWVFEYDKTCEYKDTKNCGGKNIIKTGKNEFGITVPIK